MIDLKEILINSNYKKETEELINIAKLAYKHWETYWTGFNSTYVCEEILKDFENLNDFKFFIYGGFSSSQRSRIACFRGDNIPEEDALKSNFPAQGIKIIGNFLFDNATQDDFRSFLIENGVNQIKVGDIWTIGDRGAQGIIDNSDIKHLDEKIFYLRDVKVKVNVVGIDELQIPSGRSKKLINTVEASTRLDAIASAGFRVSRTKIIERIENGMLRLNGSKVNKPTINLKIGDKLELENKGFIEILNLEITKRERWKVKLLRKWNATCYFFIRGIKNSSIWAISSVVEHYLDTVVATGSNPVSPIKTFEDLGYIHRK